MPVDTLASIADISAAEWNALAGDRWPFLRHEFLHAAEATGCVSAATGWQPRHIVLRDQRGAAIAAMPLYEKSHSWGEFVFDWAWAQAYHRHGIDYYPKLVSAVPFTPAPCRKLLLAEPGNGRLARDLVDAAVALCDESHCSSLHLQFVDAQEIPLLEDAGFLLRKDCQFHWHNRDYRDFDDFLAGFSSAKRRKVRQDRRRVADQGITFRQLQGDQADSATWALVHELISNTFLRRGSMPYFNLEFFVEVAKCMPQNLLMILAERQGQTVAAAVFYRSSSTLYGRYWGAEAAYDALHFETCYYQGIEFCIRNQLQLFEPGTQGEHKISRGFQPAATWSAHRIGDVEFASAIDRYLSDERGHIDRYMAAVDEHSPYKDSGQ